MQHNAASRKQGGRGRESATTVNGTAPAHRIGEQYALEYALSRAMQLALPALHVTDFLGLLRLLLCGMARGLHRGQQRLALRLQGTPCVTHACVCSQRAVRCARSPRRAQGGGGLGSAQLDRTGGEKKGSKGVAQSVTDMQATTKTTMEAHSKGRSAYDSAAMRCSCCTMDGSAE
jgi:hypothetical protein